MFMQCVRDWLLIQKYYCTESLVCIWKIKKDNVILFHLKSYLWLLVRGNYKARHVYAMCSWT